MLIKKFISIFNKPNYMTRQEVIDSVISNKSHSQYCYELCRGREIYKDLYQFVILQILEMPEEKLLQKAQDLKKFQNWVRFSILFNATSKTAPFYRQYRFSDYGEITNQIPDIADNTDEELLELVNNILEQEHEEWRRRGLEKAYNVELLKEYAEVGSYRDLAAKTGLKYRSIHHIVKELIDRINENITRYNS